jgi:hypothetical protein
MVRYDMGHLVNVFRMKGKTAVQLKKRSHNGSAFLGVPGMGDNLAVKVRYELGSRNH